MSGNTASAVPHDNRQFCCQFAGNSHCNTLLEIAIVRGGEQSMFECIKACQRWSQLLLVRSP